MNYYTTDRDGVTELDPPPYRLRDVLRSLQEDRPEHAEVWLTHAASGWQATVFANGTIHLENDGLDEPVRELKAATPETALSIWQALASGQIEELKNRPWSLSNG